MTVFIMYREKK